MTMMKLTVWCLMVALVACQYGPIASPLPVQQADPSAPVQQSPLMPYSFEYAVNDDNSGLDFGHKESSDGTAVTGTYYVLLPDGRVETVVYKADANGYVADVSFEGEANDAAQPQQAQAQQSTSGQLQSGYGVQAAQSTSGQLQAGYGGQAALPPTTAYPTVVPTTPAQQTGYFVPAAAQPIPTTIPATLATTQVPIATTPVPLTTTIPVATTTRVATTPVGVPAAPQVLPTTAPATTTIPIATTTRVAATSAPGVGPAPVAVSASVSVSTPVVSPAPVPTASPATASVQVASTWPAVKAPVVPAAPVVDPTPTVIPANAAGTQTTPAGYARATPQVATQQDVNYSSYGQAAPTVPTNTAVPVTSAPLISALGQQKTTARPNGY